MSMGVWGAGGGTEAPWMVAGCTCGAVSCQAAEMGANVKKKTFFYDTHTETLAS